MFADDANLHEAGGNLRLGLEFGKRQHWGDWFLRLDNALDRRSVGAVVVNSGNGRYYQPATDRTFLIGINLQRE
jgi:iron complex outermembrane receptor protein